MIILKKGSTGEYVKILQQFLGITIDGDFGPKTESAVIQWQKDNGIIADGIVGPETMNLMGLLDTDTSSTNLNIKKHWLNSDEYYKGPVKKDWIFLHHTAGWHDPYQTINGWELDARGAVGTEYVLGGSSILGNNDKFDGELVSAFPAGGYAWHLSIGNTEMHRNSIGIEVCNFGFLTKGGFWKYNSSTKKNEWKAGKPDSFYTYVGTEAHPSQVIKLDEKFRGYEYWQKYSEKQIQVLKDWILYISDLNNIDPRKGLVELIQKVGGHKAFDTCDVNMCAATKGLWLHTNVVLGKVDLFPQPEVVDMLLSL